MSLSTATHLQFHRKTNQGDIGLELTTASSRDRLEVELIGFHASELNHVDPRCPKCRNVRAVLFEVAHFLPQEVRPGDPSLTYNVDSHSNSILCLPALGNRAAVSVSVYISWSRSIGHSFEMDLSIEIKTFLNRWGIHQR